MTGQGNNEQSSKTAAGALGGIRYRLLLALSRAALYWERLWPAIWPALGIAALFLGTALLDLLPWLPQWLHGLILLSFAAAFAWGLRFAFDNLPAVDGAAARHRLERDSGLEHRPLQGLDDHLLVGADDRAARRLWQRHKERLASQVRAMRLTAPAPDIARHDQWALRAPLAVILVVGLAAGWGDVGSRLLRSVTPMDGAGPGAGDIRISVWITPPSYTRQAPVFLEAGGKTVSPGTNETYRAETGVVQDTPVKALKVPQGSALLAQITGRSGGGLFGSETAPDLLLGGVETSFAPVGGGAGAGSYRVEGSMETTGAQEMAIVRGGRTLARWPVVVVADAPPRAEFITKPGRTGRASLKTEFEAADDYGLASITMVVRHPQGRSVPGGGKEIRLVLPLADPGAVLTQGIGIHDLSAHPWAGIQVIGRIEAKDGRGQIGRSDDLNFLLPQRTFNHPVARALVEQRRVLSENGEDAVGEVLEVLSDLALRPAHFFDDTVVFLSLSIAQARLRHGEDEARIAEVQKLLWDTALRIEDGDFAIAERDLMDLQGQVMEAMRKGADSEEVQRLMEQLRQALDEYLKALAQELARQDLKDIPAMDPNMQAMNSQDLQDILDQAREMARNGAMDAARQLLSQLQKALDQIRRGLAMAPQQRENMAQSQRLMQGLRELTQRQRQLLDETFRQAQQNRGLRQNRQGQSDQVQRDPDGPRPMTPGTGRQSRPKQGERGQGESGRNQTGQGPQSQHQQAPRQSRPGGPNAQVAARQEALRRALGDLMLQMDEILGNIPPGMGKAERAMREASRALRKGRPGDAVPRQTEALDHLQKSQDQMAQQMAQRFGPALGLRPGNQGQRRQRGQDPFGRGSGGAFGAAVDGDVDVPSRMEMRRAREILQELRRRAGERKRPVIERDYIDRLLKQF